MKVTLIDHTTEPDITVAVTATVCRDGVPKDPAKTIANLLRRNHRSPFEHVVFRFEIQGISRACSHQLVRYRCSSPMQESQRSVKPVELDCVVPPTVQEIEAAKAVFASARQHAFAAMRQLVEMGVPLEDARYILPAATPTKLVITINASSLMNLFDQRCCLRAQWEIRAVAEEMLALCKKVAPMIFAKAGRACKNGRGCRENDPCRNSTCSK